MIRKIFLLFAFLVQCIGASPIYNYDSLDGILNHGFVETDGDLEYNLLSLNDRPLIFFDFIDCETKVRMFHRIYAFAELGLGEAEFPGKILPVSAVKGESHGGSYNGFTKTCGHIDGHDYSLQIIADFFTTLWKMNKEEGFPDEFTLLGELFDEKLLIPTRDPVKVDAMVRNKLWVLGNSEGKTQGYYSQQYEAAIASGDSHTAEALLRLVQFSPTEAMELVAGWAPAPGFENFAIISTDQVDRQKISNEVPEESPSMRIWRRLTTVSHEVLHAYFFNNADYRRQVGEIWQAHVVEYGEKLSSAEDKMIKSEMEYLYRNGPLNFYYLTDQNLLLNEFQSFTASQGRDFLFWVDEMIRRKYIGETIFDPTTGGNEWKLSEQKAALLTSLKAKHGFYISDILRMFIRLALASTGYTEKETTISQKGLKQLYQKYSVPTSVKVRHILVGHRDSVFGETEDRSFAEAKHLSDLIVAKWKRTQKHTLTPNKIVKEYSNDPVDKAYWVNNFGIELQNKGEREFNRVDLIYQTGLIFENYHYEDKVRYPFEFFDAYSQLTFALQPGEIRQLEANPEKPSHPRGILIMQRLR